MIQKPSISFVPSTINDVKAIKKLNLEEIKYEYEIIAEKELISRKNGLYVHIENAVKHSKYKYLLFLNDFNLSVTYINDLLYKIEQDPRIAVVVLDQLKDVKYIEKLNFLIRRNSIHHLEEFGFGAVKSSNNEFLQSLLWLKIIGYKIVFWNGDKIDEELELIETHFRNNSSDQIHALKQIFWYVENNVKRLNPLRSAIFQILKHFLFDLNLAKMNFNYFIFLLKLDFLLPKVQYKTIKSLRKNRFNFYQ